MEPIKQVNGLLIDASGRGLDCHIGVVSEEEDPGIWQSLGKEIAQPHLFVIGRPCCFGVELLVNRI